MDDLIRRSDVLDLSYTHDTHDGWGIEAVDEESIMSIPAVDAVARGVFEQVAWERDIAIKQLADIGKSLGEKMDDVAKVVRCRECKNWDTDWEPLRFNFDNHIHYCGENDIFPTGDWFCKAGQRREDGDASERVDTP